MRILTVLDGEPWGEHHISGSLTQLGHDVHRFVYGAAVGEFYGHARRPERQRKNEELVRLARTLSREGGLDLIFCYVYDDFLLEESARELARVGVPLVNYNVDMTNQWYRQIGSAKHFTYVLCAQRAHMQALQSYGARPLYFPMAARATDFERSGDSAPAAPITFLGSPTPYRQLVLSALEREGLPLAVYGRHWLNGETIHPEYGFEKTLSDVRHYALARIIHEGPTFVGSALASRASRLMTRTQSGTSVGASARHEAIPGEALGAFFRNSQINLGFTRMRGPEFGRDGNNQVKLRDFEVPLAGGFYLVEEAPEHRELYDVDREIVTWRSVDELIDKTRYYLAHSAERVRIATAGRARASRDHTWQRRFDDLFRTLGIA